MQIATDHHAHRRPSALDMGAAALLLATVALHVIAMAPTYFSGPGQQSLMAQTDQAALYSVLAAAWAGALVVGLIGPHRTPVAAALAVGLAATELGFRVADLGGALRYGAGTAGAGLWLMEAAWAVGAAAAVVAVLAARSRHASRRAVPEGIPAPTWGAADSEPPAAANPYAPVEGESAGEPASEAAPMATAAPTAEPAAVGAGPAAEPWSAAGETTSVMAAPDPTDRWEAMGPPADDHPAETPEEAHERLAWSALVAVLALLVAGAFLPAWDRAFATSSQSGQTIYRNLGNAFSGPWQQVIGTVLAAVALAAVPIVAIRLRNRAVGAAAAIGALLGLTTQLVAAVVQVDQPLSPGELGFTAAQVNQLGLVLGLKLTGWFTVDALAAYALFAAVLVWATLRHDHEYSPGTVPSAPEARSEAMRTAS